MIRLFRALAIVPFLYACGTISNKSAPESLTNRPRDPSAAIVILSTGAKDSCTSAATFLRVLPAGEPYRGKAAGILNVDGGLVPSDFPDHYGNVHALQIPSGRYYVTPFIANPYISVPRMPRWDFVANPGEVLYIGEFFVPVHCGPNVSGRFEDRWDRDADIFKSRMGSDLTASVQRRVPGVPSTMETR